MSIPDKAMGIFCRLITRWTPEEINSFEADFSSGKIHPKDAKMKLAREIVTIYHGEDEAGKAEAEFVRVFQEQGQPEEIDEYKLEEGQTVLDVLEGAELVESRSQARRLLQQGAVRLDDQKLEDPPRGFSRNGCTPGW